MSEVADKEKKKEGKKEEGHHGVLRLLWWKYSHWRHRADSVSSPRNSLKEGDVHKSHNSAITFDDSMSSVENKGSDSHSEESTSQIDKGRSISSRKSTHKKKRKEKKKVVIVSNQSQVEKTQEVSASVDEGTARKQDNNNVCTIPNDKEQNVQEHEKEKEQEHERRGSVEEEVTFHRPQNLLMSVDSANSVDSVSSVEEDHFVLNGSTSAPSSPIPFEEANVETEVLEKKLQDLEEKEQELKDQIASLAQLVYSKKAKSLPTENVVKTNGSNGTISEKEIQRKWSQDRVKRKKVSTQPIPLQYRNFLGQRNSMPVEKPVSKDELSINVYEEKGEDDTSSPESLRTSLQPNIPAELKKLERFLETLQLQRLLPKFEEAEATYDILCAFSEEAVEKLLNQMGIALAPRMQIIAALKQRPESMMYQPITGENTDKRKYSATDFNPKDINLGNVIGQGQFGAVFRGTYKGIAFAFKRLHENQLKDFNKEAKHLEKLTHKNIVRYLGLYTAPDNENYIITEYMPLGSMHDLLVKRPQNITLCDAIYMALGGAKGMEYLHRKKIIHRDLAARNILVKQEGGYLTAKVGDFGMSRSLYEDGEYVGKDDLFARKWASPETLLYHVYSTASDVWSFAVALWELFMLGQAPFAQYGNKEAVEKVLLGERLSKPPHCPQPLWEMMFTCWHNEASLRPTFESMVLKIQAVYENHLSEKRDYLLLEATKIPPVEMFYTEKTE